MKMKLEIQQRKIKDNLKIRLQGNTMPSEQRLMIIMECRIISPRNPPAACLEYNP